MSARGYPLHSVCPQLSFSIYMKLQHRVHCSQDHCQYEETERLLQMKVSLSVPAQERSQRSETDENFRKSCRHRTFRFTLLDHRSQFSPFLLLCQCASLSCHYCIILFTVAFNFLPWRTSPSILPIGTRDA